MFEVNNPKYFCCLSHACSCPVPRMETGSYVLLTTSLQKVWVDTGRLNLCVRSMTTATMVCKGLRTNMQTISSTLRNLWTILHTLDHNLLLTMVTLPTTPEAILTENYRPGCRSFAQHVKNLEEAATSLLLLQTKHWWSCWGGTVIWAFTFYATYFWNILKTQSISVYCNSLA